MQNPSPRTMSHAYFRDQFRGGVYIGPSFIDVDAILSHRDEKTSLGNLRKVAGRLFVCDTNVVKAPELASVHGVINITGTAIQKLPKLTHCAYMVCTAIPFCPRLSPSTIVEYECSPKDAAKGITKSVNVGYYQTMYQEVMETPGELLIPLRELKPHLAILIDMRLRGEHG